MIEVLSAALTGMGHCTRLLPMWGPDMSTPRRLGQFYMVINPDAFVPRPVYRGRDRRLSGRPAGDTAQPGRG